MQKAIDILEVEIDSMKDAYKSEKNNAFKREYSERILSCKNAIKLLKLKDLEFYKEKEPVKMKNYRIVIRTDYGTLEVNDIIATDEEEALKIACEKAVEEIENYAKLDEFGWLPI